MYGQLVNLLNRQKTVRLSRENEGEANINYFVYSLGSAALMNCMFIRSPSPPLSVSVIYPEPHENLFCYVFLLTVLPTLKFVPIFG